MDCSLPGSSVHGDSPSKSTGVGCHARLQGIFPTQGSNPVLLHCRKILYHLTTRKAQEYWSGQPIPSPGELPDPDIELGSPALQANSLPSELSMQIPAPAPQDLLDQDLLGASVMWAQQPSRHLMHT